MNPEQMAGPGVASHATPLQPGAEAPDFELPSTPDQNVRLSEFRGRPVILVFYPEDWSPVCSDELGLYQAVLPEFQKFNAELMGISVDSAWSHLFVIDADGIIRWSYVSPVGVNPGADGILRALEGLGTETS
jgi:peroxiredoxin